MHLVAICLDISVTEHVSLTLDVVITEHMSLTLGMLVTECLLSHVTQSNDTLAAAVSEDVTVSGVKLCCCDHLIQLLHVGWLQVYNV